MQRPLSDSCGNPSRSTWLFKICDSLRQNKDRLDTGHRQKVETRFTAGLDEEYEKQKEVKMPLKFLASAI